MSLAMELFGGSRDGKPTYRLTIGRPHEGVTAAYAITTTDPAEARAFLLAYVTDATVKVELTMTASADHVYRLLGIEPPHWTPPKKEASNG